MNNVINNRSWILTSAPRPREFVLKNIKNGAIIKGNNVKQWCKEKGFPKFSEFNVYNVLSGKLRRYRDYVLPETNTAGFRRTSKKLMLYEN